MCLDDVYFKSQYFDVDGGLCTIKAWYSLDGCTLAPDFKSTYYASLIHDALYQYHVDKRLADLVFLDVMNRDGFALRKIYYYAVKWFGRQD